MSETGWRPRRAARVAAALETDCRQAALSDADLALTAVSPAPIGVAKTQSLFLSQVFANL
jgi:hypothetical protein